MIKIKLWTLVAAFLSGLILLSALVPNAVSNSQGSSQVYLPVLFQSLPETWMRVIGSGGDGERGKTVLATPDGEIYLLVEKGYGSEVSYLVVKLTAAGAIQWQKTFTPSTSATVLNGSLTTDGGLVLSGQDLLGSNEGAQIIKLNSDGTIAWQKNYGGPWRDYAAAIQQTTDGGYIFTGYAGSNFPSLGDLWLVKLDQNGIIQWQRSYDVSGVYSYGAAIQQTTDGGYIVTGHAGNSDLGFDLWVLKLDSSGTVIWQKSFGGSEDEFSRAVAQAPNGDYLVAGSTASAGSGGDDAWVARLDAFGNVVWQKSFGGSNDDEARAIYPTSDGRFAIAGNTTSLLGDVVDAWVMLLDGSGDIVWHRTYGDHSWDSAYSIQQLPDGKFLVAGSTGYYNEGPRQAWIMMLDINGEIENCDLITPTTTAVTNTTFVGQSHSTTTATAQATAADTTHPPINSVLLMTTLCSH